jgi:hypothetical protein
MLIFQDRKFIKTPFDNENEIEQVVVDNYEFLFGPNSIYLPKTLIKTSDGSGTIPDGFAIDLGSRKWYLVEAELIHHSVWTHIAPQVSKQIIATQQTISKKRLEDLAVEQFQVDETTKEKFSDLGIKEIDIRKVLGEILEKEPTVGVPIDDLTNDLKDWARTLKYNVKLWVIKKYVEFNNSANVVYELPEEFKPDLDTEQEETSETTTGSITTYDVGLSDLLKAGLITENQKILMNYKPRNGQQKKYIGTILKDGSIDLLNKTFSSLSYAAWSAIQDAGSSRKTVNGWTAWKTESGLTMADIRDKYLSENKTVE